ncbi:hypothetical protein BDW59DRAFT_113752 [Aspergillus cavernicola]|uniref:Uncharacterized protein n=1 Tax=Aspergillus cavernicola TaxID=176166 RepID=A0ABR4HYH6_9EURO
MEAASLTLGHTHARNAVLETRKSNPVAASEEHDLAAGEFATAAQSSRDHEALRTLHLLEQHHKKLAHILRFQHENPPSAAAVGVASAAAGMNPPTSSESGTSKADAQLPPRLTVNSRLPKRESSSIASNLASARGIPAQPRRASPASPTLSSQQAGAKMTDNPAKAKTSEARLRGTQTPQRERVNRTSSQQQPWSPPPVVSPTDVTSQQFVPPDAGGLVRRSHRQSSTDEPFQRFYSTFEGLVSRISAPLAFAGLPLGLALGSDNASNVSAGIRKSSANTRVDRQPAISDRTGSSAEPDISRIFSRAALKAIRGSNGGTGGMGTGNTTESFYVVPTTGGTVSYAGILTRAEKEARRSSLDEGDDDFVDARETPSSPEMLQASKGKGKTSTRNNKLTTLPLDKTLEELQMENQALRHLSDTLSKRLHMWEVNAQSSSLALQQSLKAIHHQNVPSPEHIPQSSSMVPSPSTALSTAAPTEQDQRIKELEDMIRLNEKELEHASRENEKLRKAYLKHKTRWEKLYEGAKSRREGVRTSSAGTTQHNADVVQTEETEQDMTSNELDAKTDDA